MNAQLVMPDGSLVPVDKEPVTLGRAHMEAASPSYSSAHVSRSHCRVLLSASAGKVALKLFSLSATNPTVVMRKGVTDPAPVLPSTTSPNIRGMASATHASSAVQAVQPHAVQAVQAAQQHEGIVLLQAGDSVLLEDGDRFAITADRPDLAFTVRLGTAAAAAAAAASGLPASSRTAGSGLEADACRQTPDTGAVSTKLDETDETEGQEEEDDEHVEDLYAPTVAGGKSGDAAAAGKPVLLLLVGAPGSGKSTFSKALAGVDPGPWPAGAPARARWVHVNQDCITSKGKPGTRKQCLNAASRALASGACVVIDRCNFDQKQRADFILLARHHAAPVHAVVLDIPTKVCIERAVGRTAHPGNVQGPGAAGVVARLASQLRAAGPPAAGEGIATIMTCTSDAAVACALAAWRLYDQLQYNMSGTMSATGAAAAAATSSTLSDPWAYWLVHKPETPAASVAGAPTGPAQKDLRQFFSATQKAAAGPATAKRAVPSIRAGAGNTDASNKPTSGQTPAAGIKRDQAPAPAAEPPAKRTRTGASDAVGPDASGNSGRAATTSRATQPSPSPREVNGPGGTSQTSQPQTHASGSQVGVIPAPANKAAASGSATAVPKRDAFAALMNGARQRTGAQGHSGAGTSGAGAGAGGAADSASKASKGQTEEGRMAGGAGGSGRTGANGLGSAGGAGAGKGGGDGGDKGGHDKRLFHPATQALYRMAMDPTKINIPGAYVDELCICIPDIYPKSIHHGLVVAREAGLDAVTDLRPQHLPLLAHMRRVALQWMWRLTHGSSENEGSAPTDGAEHVFRLGFHSIPSMRQLHLHIISQDLRGRNNKRKDHYQSFTTAYFLPLDLVEAQLHEHGRVLVDSAASHALLKGPIVCHRCGAAGEAGGKRGGFTFPQLVAHLQTCRAPYAGTDAVQAPMTDPGPPA